MFLAILFLASLASCIWHSVSMLQVADFSTVADLGSPMAVDISAADILDVNGVPAVAGLPICCCWLHYFDKRPCFF